MIIELDGYYHQALLIGKMCTKQQLAEMYLQATSITEDMQELPIVFCKLHGFRPLPFNVDTKVMYIIDMDTNRIYSPSYET